MEEWNKEHPEPPAQTPSDWYWFWYPEAAEPIVMEVWPDRKYWPNGYWGSKVKPPLAKPMELKQHGQRDSKEVGDVTGRKGPRSDPKPPRRRNKKQPIG